MLAKLLTLKTNELFSYSGDDEKFYDFQLDFSSNLTLSRTLAHYGIVVNELMEKDTFYSFEEN